MIRQRLAKVAKLYSPAIADCLAEMLRYDVETRVDVEELALMVFLQSENEKKEDINRVTASKGSNQPPQQQTLPQQQPPMQVIQKQYQQNPPHVQQKYVVLAPGAQPPPTRQVSLNPDAIGLPVPNYNYSRIGP